MAAIALLNAASIYPSVTARRSFGAGPTSPSKFAGHLKSPCIRKPRPQRKFLAAYQAARREFFEEVGAVGGGIILVLDADLKANCGHEVIVPPTQH
jgi:hypothetical protein